jgi:hypothetical protein
MGRESPPAVHGGADHGPLFGSDLLSGLSDLANRSTTTKRMWRPT